MLKIAFASILTGLVLLPLGGPAFAQEGCKTVATSCTGLSQACEKQCQSSNNAGRCMGALCAPKLETCKSTGVWKGSTTGAACWKTNNRT